MMRVTADPSQTCGTQNLRTALAAAGFWWLPEVTGRKLVPKPIATGANAPNRSTLRNPTATPMGCC